MHKIKQELDVDTGLTILTKLPQWLALEAEYKACKQQSTSSLFMHNSHRLDQYSGTVGELFIDYSKNGVNDQTVELLLQLARSRNLEQWRDRMFEGYPINFTEHRAVLHTALRNKSGKPVMHQGKDVMPQIDAVKQRIRQFTDKVRSGEWKGVNGETITDIVNIGIGGSDLGPRMAVQALEPYIKESLKFHFVANIDCSEVGHTLRQLDPHRTLFIVESKTFTTQETLANATTARDWLLQHSNNDKAAIARHFVAVSTNTKAVEAFGIDTANMFEFWDWVGGRYSLWSAIGLPVVLAVGMDNFEEMLDGAWEMDQHFRTAPLRNNIPVMLAMIGIWYINFHNAKTHAIVPYDYYMRDLPHYLQQADMESNGKCITRDGESVDYNTGPVIWGETGVNGQHAYFQLIHQGTQIIPADFIVPIHSHYGTGKHHDILIANFIAQTEALMKGRNAQEVEDEMRAQGLTDSQINKLLPHRVFEGNRPTTSIVMDRLTPSALGSLIAMYEHKIFVQGIIWGINSFDQWGVELGKVLASRIQSEIADGETVDGHGQSTDNLINRYLKYKFDK
ncbi:Glucose-6-phosphate isomerase [hydrothermal vent metagenome]|uniref:glucose-6-phosphate isomerase n=1 Tax=hydrothermal vent metagenome TaxID=652676 RepID=A0A3B0YCL3_9ZZZZ